MEMHPQLWTALQAVVIVAAAGLAGWLFSAMGYTLSAWRAVRRDPGPAWVADIEQQLKELRCDVDELTREARPREEHS